jgi:hypothetical protein
VLRIVCHGLLPLTSGLTVAYANQCSATVLQYSTATRGDALWLLTAIDTLPAGWQFFAYHQE